MNKILIVVDMQNDFLTGTLANESAVNIIPQVSHEIMAGDYNHIIFTRDTHHSNYLQTPEGQKLPIEHCIINTDGWNISKELINAEVEKHLYENKIACSVINKPTFGTLDLSSMIANDTDEVTFCGTCTDICVVSNALILKAMRPSLTINVLANACAGLTTKKHEEALSVMESCQINVI